MFRFAVIHLLSLPAWLAVWCVASADAPHRHGTAELDLVVEAKDVIIALRTPAANVVGFEHAPATDAERAALDAARHTLKRGEALFEFDPGAGCRLVNTEVHMALSDAAGHDDANHEDDTDDHGHLDAHGDIEADWTFRCEAPRALTAIAVHLFDHFDGFQSIEVRRVGPDDQGGALLERGARSITW